VPAPPSFDSVSTLTGLLAWDFSDASPLGVGVLAAGASLLLLGAVAGAQYWRRERAARVERVADASPTAGPKSFEDAPVALLSFTPSGTLLRSNREAARLLDLPAEFGDARQTWATLFGADSLAEFTMSLERSPRAELEIAVGTGQFGRWLRVSGATASRGFEVCIEDITQRRMAEAELQYAAMHDPLTGLLNRRGLEVRLKHAADRFRDGEPVAVAYLDLDRFKPVNDMFGHAAGDQVLRQVAARLREHIGNPHTLARVGGDEFIMLFVGIPLEEARTMCDAALHAVHDTPFRFEDKAFRVDGSIGLTPVYGSEVDQDVIVACDRACAEAKRDGGGRVILASDGAAAALELKDEQRLLQVLGEDSGNEGLITHLQPIVSLHHPTKSLSYEVLVRLVDDDGEPMAPGRFLNACERNGLSSRLDRQVLARALRWLEESPAHREALGFAALNVARASLSDECFIADVRSLLRTHPAAARRICFEISEEAAIDDPKGIRRFVDIVRDFGARLALDDFGAQYTSFSHIREFRSDFVKIDAALIRDIDANPASFSIVRSIVDVCHDLGMECIAECAETESILRTLLELDLDYAQGYALSRPLDQQTVLDAQDGAALVANPQIAALLGRERSSPLTRFAPRRQGSANR